MLSRLIKTRQLIKEKVWFPAVDKMVKDAVKSCIPCQASYPGPNRRAIDFGDPFPSGQYILVVVDGYSRFPEVEIVSSTVAKVVIPRLESIFAWQDFPTVVKPNNDPPFQGQEFANFAATCGFKHRRITPL